MARTDLEYLRLDFSWRARRTSSFSKASTKPKPITPAQIKAMAMIWGRDRDSPSRKNHSRATNAPEVLQMGEEMDNSMYRSPKYPSNIEKM